MLLLSVASNAQPRTASCDCMTSERSRRVTGMSLANPATRHDGNGPASNERQISSEDCSAAAYNLPSVIRLFVRQPSRCPCVSP